MVKIIAVANNKGGVGKTTLSISLAAEAGIQKKRVLVVDTDPQQNAYMVLVGDTKPKNSVTLSDLVLQFFSKEKQKISSKLAITPANPSFVGVEVLVGDPNLQGIDLIAAHKINKFSLIKEILKPLRDSYDLIIIDTPPATDTLTLASLCACDGYIVPIDMSEMAQSGYLEIDSIVDQLKEGGNCKNIKFIGCVYSMFENRKAHATKLSMDLAKKNLFDRVMDLKISRSTHMNEALICHSHLQDERNHKISIEYQKLYKHTMGVIV